VGKPLSVVICDDSRLARKQMERALAHWNVEITHARHGLEALEAIRAGKGELLFLDLNMPLLDGYQVLERIRANDLPTLTIVVSGDIQPQARERVLQLGALDFIRKPLDPEQLSRSLRSFGLLEALSPENRPADAPPQPAKAGEPLGLDPISQAFELTEYYQELANIAMGQAADRLARLLQVFIELPIPRVQLIELCELDMALHQAIGEHPITTICQGFIAPEIAGEALLMFNDASTQDLALLLGHQGTITHQIERELQMDIANLLIGAFLTGLGAQLDLSFSQGSPIILGQHHNLPNLQQHNHWSRTLSIDVSYRIEGRDLSCDLLLLFTEDSLPALNELVRHL
jgi:Response regulator containing CheY-like receiver, AAA-type ATPase, and DNA-binding domains